MAQRISWLNLQQEVPELVGEVAVELAFWLAERGLE